ncbi:MAG: SpoIIE family protein phosphatase [Chloroflexi bacterium]|nr:SpoIIE family protein phosphatase [Chloroflexota bacterium]
MLASTYATLQDNSTHGEDSFLVRDLGGGNFLDVVLDGVTGHGGGEASQGVAEALETASIASTGDLIAVLEDQNAEFFQVGGGRFLLTTITAALMLDGTVHVIHAGDSPFYHIQTDSFKQLAGRIGGLLRPGATKVLGSSEELSLSSVEITVAAGDRLLLATDGISDNLPTAELVQAVRDAASPDEGASRIKSMVETRLEHGLVPEQLGGRYRHDDQTAILRFFGSS